MLRFFCFNCVLVFVLQVIIVSAAEPVILPQSKAQPVVYVPKTFTRDKSENYYLLVGLHGAGDTSQNFLNFWRATLAQLDQNNVLVACPEGSGSGGSGKLWQAKDVDAIIETGKHLAESYGIKPEKVWLTGFSMGCSMGFLALTKAPAAFRCFGGFANGLPGGLQPRSLASTAGKTGIFLCIGKKDAAYPVYPQLLRLLIDLKIEHEGLDPDDLGHQIRRQEVERFIAYAQKQSARALEARK